MTLTSTTTILYCHCAGADIISPRVRKAVFTGLRASGRPIQPVGDLCALVAGRDQLLQNIAAGRDIRIAACHERAVRWLFAAAGAPLPTEGVNIVNMIGRSAEEILDALLPKRVGGKMKVDAGSAKPPRPADDRIAWFPVIDYDRCTNCKQCLNFCLFGVFELTDEGTVRVANPGNCKLNCPACARICPETAIIFPKHPSPPINGGEQAGGEPTEVNLAEALKGDVYQVLRQRQDDQTAFDVERAIEDRKKCYRASNMLEKLGDRIDQACDCDCQQPAADADDDAGQCECDCECDPSDNDCCR